ncbi:MAG: SH3 domain-containing protein [Spirochaetota bacterium]
MMRAGTRRARFPRAVVLGVACALLIAVAGTAFAEELSVQVRETRLREQPRNLSAEIERLSYGDRVTVVERREGWVLVRHAEQEGWLSESAVTTKEIVLEASDEDVESRTTDREVALAGRGFNEDVEEQYRQDTGLSYREIDELEERNIEDEELVRFLEEGELRIPGGAQ